MPKGFLADTLLLAVTRLFGKPYFSRSVASSPFVDHIRGVDLSLPRHWDRDHDVAATTLAGPMTTGFRVLHWVGESAPTIIHHQGGGERPFDHIISRAFPAGSPGGVNVIAVRSPGQGTLREMETSFATLNYYMAAMACVVRLTEALLTAPQLVRSPRKLVSGYSLGGFVANRHHLLYDTADVYVPFMAGARHGEIFLSTVPASKLARRQPDQIRACLNFDREWAARDHPNVFPVLARNDRLNRLNVQLPSYAGTPVVIWDGGHLLGASQPELVRATLLDHAFSPAKSLGQRPTAAITATP
jgi:hypothetical protein